MAETIGERLRQAREARGLTIEQASQSTHIRPHYLEALEKDQREALPSSVQGRGFLRLYAGLLDLNTRELLSLWDAPPAAEQTAVVGTASDAEASPIHTAAEETSSNAMTGSPAPSAAADGRGEPPAQMAVNPFQPAEAIARPRASEERKSTPRDAYFAEREPATAPVRDPAPRPPASAPEGSSAAIFVAIGKKLREQRQALGLSIAEVERYTRLRVHYIQALEDGRLEDLPSQVQGRGMLSNYAAFLNMDEDRLLLRFAEGLQLRRIERLPKPEPQGVFTQKKRPARQAPFWRRFLTPDLIFGVGIASIILFFALWTAARISAMRAAEAQPTPPGIVEVLLTPANRASGTPPAPGTPNSEGTETANLPPLGTSVSGQSAAVNDTPAPGGEAEPALPAAPVVDTVTPQVTATLPPINGEPLQVYIVARQRAWLRVVADNNVKFLGRVVPGNAYAFSGSDRIELSTGNAAALQVFYNQNDLGVLGISGEVVNLVFSTEGLATPTPMFTPTNTPTKPATVTPQPSPTAPPTPTITPFVP